MGTTGNDTLIGTPLADVIYTLSGADEVISNGGADVIYTGSGDDQISIVGPGFIRIDAGSGFDVLQLEGLANQSYDFRLNVSTPEYFAGTKLRDVELITSRDFGANTLYFDPEAINAINPDRILFLTPDASDTIILSQEFEANPSFNTTYAGSLWTAYAAGVQTTPTDSSPALIYVLNPSGASASDWLAAHVLITDTPAEPVATSLQYRKAVTGATESSGAAVTGSQSNTTSFGTGLNVTAYTATSSSRFARFSITREDASSNQVVTYTTSSQNAIAEAGADHSVAAGQFVFGVGETNKEVWVPFFADPLRDRRTSSISLEVQEHHFNDQKEVHVLIQPPEDSSSKRLTVLSGVRL